jgi:hypothetical protein
MTCETGETVLTVGEDIPGISTPTAARNWTKIEDRRRHVFTLFRKFHGAPEVCAMPHSEIERVEIARQSIAKVI